MSQAMYIFQGARGVGVDIRI